MNFPSFDFSAQRSYNVDGRAPAAIGHEPVASINGVTPDYFDTLGTRLLRGRAFVATDRLDSPGVVIINEAMAAALFPNEDPVGRRLLPIGDQDSRPLEIVGVVENVRTIDIAPSIVRFSSTSRWPRSRGVTSLSRFAHRPPRPACWSRSARRGRARSGDHRRGPAALAASIERNAAGPQLISRILAGFAALGLGLAALGIYSFMARLVAQRTREIGFAWPWVRRCMMSFVWCLARDFAWRWPVAALVSSVRWRSHAFSRPRCPVWQRQCRRDCRDGRRAPRHLAACLLAACPPCDEDQSCGRSSRRVACVHHIAA